MCLYCTILTQKQNVNVFSPAAGCVKNPVFSQQFCAYSGPKPMRPPPVALPQNMYHWQENYVFKSANKMCTYGTILGKKKIKN